MNPEVTAKLKEIAIKHGKAFALELIAECAMPALKEVVEKSPTKIDDAVLLALGEPLKAALIDMINKA